MYAAKSGLSARMALSGRKAGSTATSHVGSAAMRACALSPSAGSSVVQMSFTLLFLMMPRTDSSGFASASLHAR